MQNINLFVSSNYIFVCKDRSSAETEELDAQMQQINAIMEDKVMFNRLKRGGDRAQNHS